MAPNIRTALPIPFTSKHLLNHKVAGYRYCKLKSVFIIWAMFFQQIFQVQ